MKIFFLLLALTLFSPAQIKPAEKSSLHKKPDVVLVKDLTSEKLTFDVTRDTPVYFTRHGKKVLGNAVKGQKAELISFDGRAFNVRIPRAGGSIVGWISPHSLSCSDPDFIENFKKVHTRQIAVNALIEAGEIALGMTPMEVVASIGTPTKKSIRKTATETSETYEYIEKETLNHYRTQFDRYGRPYQVLTHTTEEITHERKVEFTNNAVSAIEEKENLGEIQHQPIYAPIYSDFSRFSLY